MVLYGWVSLMKSEETASFDLNTISGTSSAKKLGEDH
jgi:hypothetical protein